MEDIRDNDDADAVFSGGPPRAAFDAVAIETSPNSSSNPSMRLSSASCAINPRCVPALAALVGDSGLDPSSLTLLDSLIKSNKSRLRRPRSASPSARARRRPARFHRHALTPRSRRVRESTENIVEIRARRARRASTVARRFLLSSPRRRRRRREHPIETTERVLRLSLAPRRRRGRRRSLASRRRASEQGFEIILRARLSRLARVRARRTAPRRARAIILSLARAAVAAHSTQRRRARFRSIHDVKAPGE